MSNGRLLVKICKQPVAVHWSFVGSLQLPAAKASRKQHSSVLTPICNLGMGLSGSE